MKALSVLLQTNLFPFVIDLAVLAARREYLNLDKWLSDQLNEHGEAFVKAIVSFIQRKFPTLMQAPLKEEHLVKANVTKEAMTGLLISLQQVSMSLSSDLKEPIMVMIQNCQPLMSQQRPLRSTPNNVPPVGPVRPTPRQPPPAAPSSMFGNYDLASQFGDRLNLGTAPVSTANSSSAFSTLPSSMRNMAPSPGSPSRMFGAPGAPVSAHTPDGGSSPSLFNLVK